MPLRLYHWNHRFDDPHRRYRTIYSAKKSATCLREVLADLRPNLKARQEFNRLFPGQTELQPIPNIQTWRKVHVLAEADIISDKRLFIHVENLNVRHYLENKLLDLLKHYGIEHLNISEIRSKNRDLTRAISREIYEHWDSAGIEFRSNLDNEPCYASFEGRSRLKQIGRHTSLADDIPVLMKICREYGLQS